MKLQLAAIGSAVALGTAGAAAADNGHAKHAVAVKAHVSQAAEHSHVGPAALFDAAAAYLQIDAPTLFQDLRNGQSLAQIAVAHGKTADGLAASIASAAKAPLDNAVASGKLTATQEASLVARIQKTVALLVNRAHG